MTLQSSIQHGLHWFAACCGVAMLLTNVVICLADEPSGEKVYRKRCAACHGPKGEGSEEYAKPLAGDRSVEQLQRLIAKTMPKDAEEKCVGEEAHSVATYIYDAFYSKAAQERNRPPRIELSRLTVRQYGNSVADLVGRFRDAGRWDEKRGLHGEYFKSRQMRTNERVIDRLDDEVKFDFGVFGPKTENFGKYGPEPELFEAKEFSIRWEGSVLAPDTGEYEFIVKTEHATRLWVNDLKQPLIDAWVKSGHETEYRGSLFLLGGRVYPVRLEFSKSKQGVDDSKEKKAKAPPVKASIALEWKVPHGEARVIPGRNLKPNRFPETFVVDTPFPPDDRSIGYERGTTISKAWDTATTDAAILTANYVVAHLGELAGVREGAADREAKLREFCRRFAERALRRPLNDEQRRLHVEHPFASTRDLDTAVKRVVLLILKSPYFLYPELGESKDGYVVASRLSLGLWDSLPDQALLDAAAKGQLATKAQLRAQAERMLGDLRTRAKLRDFLFQWLKIDQYPDLAKDVKQFPGFDRTVAADLRTSLDLFLEEVLWSEASDFRRLFLDDALILNGRLARFYGADLPADAPFQRVGQKPGERAGLLTHPYLMATFAYTATSSPIHRGVFLVRNVLGVTLSPPPEAFAPLPPDLHPRLTTRERIALQTQPQACVTCHGMINPLGFTLEHFDAVGRYREKEKDRPIDSTGAYETRSGKLVKFTGVRDLAEFLAGSEETHAAFVEKLFHYLLKQPIRAFGPQKAAEFRRSFADKQYNVRKLVVEMIVESALLE